MSGVLRCENVTVRAGEATLVEDVSFDLPRGEFCALIGPNGAGKTTLLRAILGELRHEGRITVGTRLGYVPQRLELDRALPMRVLEFLALGLQRRPLLFGVSARSRERATSLLERVGAAPLAERPLGGLSGGELQRVLLAAALQDDPGLLLLDEPAAGVDVRGESRLHDLLQEEVRRGATVVLVSHDLSVVADLTDHVLCLNRRLLCEGNARDLLTAETIARVFGANAAVYDHHRPHPHGGPGHHHDHEHQH
jgi:zinc transport system ATP-binding protein